MAEEVTPTKEETGGVVTTVKAEITQDQDVIARLKAQADENDAEKAAAKSEVDKAEKKIDDKAPTKAKSVEDDDNDTLDFKSLSPAQQKAVAKLYKDRRQEKRETKKLLEKMEALETRIADKRTEAAPVVKAQESGRPRRPRPEDFDKTETYDEAVEQYEDALYDFRLKKESREIQDQTALEEDDKVVKSFNKAARAFAEEHDDYEEVMEDSEAPLSPRMFGAVLEHGPVLGYYFAKHPKDAGRISEMTDKDADKAIMRIVMKIEDETAEAAKETQKAPGTPPAKKPDPPNPTAGRGSAGTVVKDRSQMTFKEREKEFAKRNPGAFTYDV